MRAIPDSSAASSRGRDEKLRIVVLGYVVRGPLGGMAWHHLNYVLGLARLGHDVLFLEDSDDYESCCDPERNVVDRDPTCGLRFAAAAFARLGLGSRWCYFDAHRAAWHGPRAADGAEFCRSADVLLNVSFVNPLREWSREVPIRVLIDTDPVFTQVRHLREPRRRALAEAHNRFFTFGENIPTGRSAVPDDGLPWQATRQPVVLNAWPVAPPRPYGPFTSVMQWDSYPAQAYGGVSYGMKSRSFEAYRDLPRRTTARMETAMGGADAPRDSLRERGWRLEDPRVVGRDPWTYQRYLQDAAAEWSVAKHGYVATRSGWFSERSAVFLATGRPVVVQDTGFSDVLPTGRGLLAFDSLDGAVEAIEEVRRNYTGHCAAARRVAETHFDSSLVLGSLLERALGVATAAPVSAAAGEAT